MLQVRGMSLLYNPFCYFLFQEDAEILFFYQSMCKKSCKRKNDLLWPPTNWIEKNDIFKSLMSKNEKISSKKDIKLNINNFMFKDNSIMYYMVWFSKMQIVVVLHLTKSCEALSFRTWAVLYMNTAGKTTLRVVWNLISILPIDVVGGTVENFLCLSRCIKFEL